MNCSRCGRAIGGVFPGTKVTCECGADNVARASVADPYREPSPPIPNRSTLDDVPVDAASKKERRHPCPRCRLSLGHAGGGVFACGGCEGTFFSSSALETLVERARNEGDTDTAESLRAGVSLSAEISGDVLYLPCPICDERMNRAIFGRKSGIVVDVCAQHGTWFDHGEVEIAIRFARSHEVLTENPKAQLTAERIQPRAEVEGAGLTFIERLAIAIRWLRGD